MIGPAGTADADEIAALERMLFGPDAWSREQVVAELNGADRGGWVVRGPELTAYLLAREAGDAVDLHRIGVHPGRQRAGLGSALLAHGLAEWPGRWLLEVAERNGPARALYRRHGFVEIDRRRRYYRDGSDALVLERAAADPVSRAASAVG